MRKALPFALSAAVVLLDQVTKAIVVATIPEGGVGASFFGGFLRFIHVRNDAVAFSLGDQFAVPVKIVLFIILPVALVTFLSWAVVAKKAEAETTPFQRWLFAGVVGGGIGNLIDRVFRQLRVVDWISVRFYGFLGMEYFPTFNIADSAVVVCVILLLVSFIAQDARKGRGLENGRERA